MGAERAIIACAASGQMQTISGRVLPSDFASLTLGRVYAAAEDVFSANGAVDPVTLTESLRSRGKLRESILLTKSLESRFDVAQVESYVELIRGEATRRRVCAAASAILAEAARLDPVALCARATQLIFDATRDADQTAQPVHIKVPIKPLFERVIKRLTSGIIEPNGLPTGIEAFDSIIDGMQNGDIVIVAGRPGMGKSSFAMAIVLNVSKSGVPILIFSPEMTKEALTIKLVSLETGIGTKELKSGINFRREDFSRGCLKIASLPIHLQDAGTMSVTTLRSQAMRSAAQHGCGLIVVDYMQLIMPSGEQRNQSDESKVAEVSKTLKAIAKDMSVPILALAQLNRAIEKREGKPQLSDLRSSGQLEQDASVIAFLHRERNSDGKLMAETTLCVRKNREAEDAEAPMVFHGPTQNFVSLSRRDDHRGAPDRRTGEREDEYR